MCVSFSGLVSHTHTHTHRCWPFISYRSNTELLVGDIIAYFILCAWITLSFDFTKTLFCDIKINSNSFEQENGAVLKYVSTETCITERDVQKHKNRVLTYIQHRTITKDLQLMLHPQIRRKPEMIFTIKNMKHQYFLLYYRSLILSRDKTIKKKIIVTYYFTILTFFSQFWESQNCKKIYIYIYKLNPGEKKSELWDKKTIIFLILWQKWATVLYSKIFCIKIMWIWGLNVFNCLENILMLVKYIHINNILY